MNFIIRADASIVIGTGHVMRCLTIAEQLKNEGHVVLFYMKAIEGNLIEFVQNKGFLTIDSWERTDTIIIDHYEIDEVEEKELYQFANKIVVIDDLANRNHCCDVIIDQNLLPNYETRYDLLVPEKCKKLLGPKYLIMRKEFINIRKSRRERNDELKKILVFMGGTDPTHETLKVIEALNDFEFTKVHIVCGDGNIQKEQIKSICLEKGYYYHQQIDYLGSLMEEVDFSIGAGGSTTWERCYIGLPSSCTIVADNQIEGTNYLESQGVILNLGHHSKVTVEHYKKLIVDTIKNPKKLRKISEKGLLVTKSNGSNNPWLNELVELNK
ncbi:hypothetical protein KZO01_18180 [Kurthia zopfii]|uniref:UDP-2,4-diacetamido-2,4, 6-trideoxy-beta-L-altropyranose hydrolase n=1 Tax=Kurthia zopfii TaxID=1650 RepID=A0A8B4Q7R2_9BACL|nr:UDP-2,4-diacetamido-2,4,6-trideoxy-beta-L-altropyranose hydrolase [Kurthia zopfii]PWI22637.1 UDP-2,4-diacetamido-2,4,6-trideoxy-beta-L-altropyranose hydrolase [Kurthia zopfii]TDR39261.1 UDP-2,4-diacetamido-2,4,6-trideoxy-beta-L-altropyranose hydrolase [Kurthia zopfii]GEK31509.1 hypothetical protein KZO01_18180 [Kurthia zopfii]STX08806.1 undecaprenyldiphospho-muramoylpentapeptide beta-N- acetylglucosaminyltransferase [Kurthia zopfii]